MEGLKSFVKMTQQHHVRTYASAYHTYLPYCVTIILHYGDCEHSYVILVKYEI